MISLGAGCQTPMADPPPLATEGKGYTWSGASPVMDGYVLFTLPVADLTSELVQKKVDAEMFRTIHEGRSNTSGIMAACAF